MTLSNEKYRQNYIESIAAVEAKIQRAVSGEIVSDDILWSAQSELDTLAEKYQFDERLGTDSYKIYELQAYIHYYKRNDQEALEFINYAIDTKGRVYPKAEDLLQSITDVTMADEYYEDESNLTKEEKRSRLIGLEGWLALFVVGTFISLLMTAYRFFADGFFSQLDIDAFNQYQPGLGDTLQTLSAIENLMIIIYIALVVVTLVLLFRRRRIAKWVAISSLAFCAVYGILDYAIVSSIYSSSGLSEILEIKSALTKHAGELGRNIIGAFIWIPYFLVSKRVEATLTK